MIELDHIALAGETLEAVTDHAEKVLGQRPGRGGEHAVFHTHNTLLGLEDGLYFEAIAINPTAPTPDRPRWFDLDRFSGPPRLTNWICRCADLDATLAALPEGFGRPVDLQRGDLRWRMAVPADGILPFDNCAPALIEWQGDAHPAQMLPNAGLRLDRLTIHHPDAADLRALLSPHFADPRVAYETGPAGLEAIFSDGTGTRVLR